MTRFSRRISGTLPRAISSAKTFDNGGFAHAGLAEQDRVVLGAPAKNLDDALDFILTSDDRVHSPFRAISVSSRPKAFKAGVLTSLFFSGVFSGGGSDPRPRIGNSSAEAKLGRIP